MAIKSVENFRSLRKKGITIRKTADVIIASFCIEKKLPLVFSERNFKLLSITWACVRPDPPEETA